MSLKSTYIFLFTFYIISSTFAQYYDYQLIARNIGSYTLWDGKTIRIFGFAETLGGQINIPAPTLYGYEGDTMIIKLRNLSQGAPHTIHPHGLDVDQANDGVPHLSTAVNHMEEFYYKIPAPHPGTYLYHCHVTSPIHVQAGMYGLIVIRPNDSSNHTWDGGIAFDREYMWLMSEVDTVWHQDNVLDHPHDTNHATPVAIPPYQPQYFLINGKSQQQLSDSNIAISGKANEIILLRLANIGFLKNEIIFPEELNAIVISTDGMPIVPSYASDTLLLTPGERYEVLIQANSEFTDSITVNYINLNTRKAEGKEVIPVSINGFLGMGNKKEYYNIKIFPNPTSSKLVLEGDYFSDNNIEIKLFNIHGQLILTEKFYTGKRGHFNHFLDVSNIMSGTYILKVENVSYKTKKEVYNTCINIIR